MARKDRFPPEDDTQPALRGSGTPTTKMPRASGPAPKGKRSETATEPPPNKRASTKNTSKPEAPRSSGVKSRRSARSEHSGATVDEVVADLSRDPRREDDG